MRSIHRTIHRTIFATASLVLSLASSATGAGGDPCAGALPACHADLTGPRNQPDGVVNVADLLVVISNWGQTQQPPGTGPRPLGDCAPLPNGDCAVNVADLLAVISNWSTCPVIVDSDGDRIPDSQELSTCDPVQPPLYGTDPFNPDTDGDGLLDGDEAYGTLDGLNLPALGCSPLRKNLLLEVDWFDDDTNGAHSHRPSVNAVNQLVNAFANAPVINPCGSSGITLIVDYGQGGALTGGNLIPGGDTVVLFDSEFNAYKAANFASNRNGYFYYSIHAHRYNSATNGSSGIAEINGDDHMVTLQHFLSDSNVSKTMMHEFGHNLGLRHGGFENRNYKPNYNSVMNYRFQLNGVDVNCDSIGDAALNYSNGTRIPLNETALDELAGVCGFSPIDWNGNFVIDAVHIARNINCSPAITSPCGNQPSGCNDSTCDLLNDWNDWLNLSYTGISHPDFAPTEVIECDPPRPHF